jgi:DNA invertase Pin-like site-specific DNA recombinase
LQQGDTLVVWRLDRLGRSMHHLVELIEVLRNRGVGFRSVSDGLIDTTSPSGELIFHIFSALAQFERRLIQERTKAGLASARARGRLGGRPPIDLEEAKVRAARKLHDDHTLNIDDICNTLHISRSTYYLYVRIKSQKQPPQGVRDQAFGVSPRLRSHAAEVSNSHAIDGTALEFETQPLSQAETRDRAKSSNSPGKRMWYAPRQFAG